MDEAGCDGDIDLCMTLILNELWVNGYNTRSKIAKMTAAQRMEIGSSHRFMRAGVRATEAFDTWLKDLKAEVRAKKTKK